MNPFEGRFLNNPIYSFAYKVCEYRVICIILPYLIVGGRGGLKSNVKKNHPVSIYYKRIT